MSRHILRYVEGRAIWSENDPSSVHPHGYLASQGRGGYAHIAGELDRGEPVTGELVRGDPGIVERDRAATRRGNQKARARPICGAWMPLAKSACARTEGHKKGHASAEAMAYNRRLWELRRVPVLR